MNISNDNVLKIITLIISSGVVFLIVDVLRYIGMHKIEEILTPDRTKYKVELVAVTYVLLTTFLYFYSGKPEMSVFATRLLLIMGVALSVVVILGCLIVTRIITSRVNYAVVIDDKLYFIIKAMDKDNVLLRNYFTKEFRKVASTSLANIDFKEVHGRYYRVNGGIITMEELLASMIQT